MIELALDPTDTRPARIPEARPARGRGLRIALLGLAGAGALGGFGVAASTLMAGLAAPQPVRLAAPGRAADWPDLKDGMPAVAGATPAVPAGKPPGKAEASEPPALRMASLPDPVVAPPPRPAPPPAAAAPIPAASLPPAPLPAAAPPVPAAAAATRRIPVPTPVAPIGPARQVSPLAPARTAAVQPPRPAETVRARELVERAAPPPAREAAVAATPATIAPASPDRPARKAAAARRTAAAEKGSGKPGTTETGRAAAPAAVAQAEAPDEETEVLGIKLPSLAPAGRKLKEGVDAIGDAVKSVF